MNYGDIHKKSASPKSHSSNTKEAPSTMQPGAIGDIPTSTKAIGKVVQWLNTFEDKDEPTNQNEKKDEKKEDKKKNSKTADQLIPLINRLRRMGIHNEDVLSRLQRNSELSTRRSASTARNQTQQYNKKPFTFESTDESKLQIRTSRIDELAKPKKQHHYYSHSSPVWKITRSALSVEPSSRIKELAEPKNRFTAQNQTRDLNSYREVPPPNYQCSSRISALARPKDFVKSSYDLPLPKPVRQIALRSVASDHVQMLAKPKVYISPYQDIQFDKKKKRVGKGKARKSDEKK